MRTIVIAVASLVALACCAIAPASARERDRLLGDCPTLPQCMDILDRAIPEKELGFQDREARAIRDILKPRFRDAAKKALLEKAIHGHDGWRNLASAVLAEWGDWTEADIPALREALKASPGGWIARCLGEVGTPDAIRVLTDDLLIGGFESQTGWTLYGIGPKVLPYLLPVLEASGYEDRALEDDYRKDWREVAKLIGEFRARAIVVADDWIGIAKNKRKQQLQRIAALRGLHAMGGYIQEAASGLRPLLRDRDKKVASAALQTLVSAHDPTVVRKLAASCRPQATKWDEYALDSFICLRTVSEFGANAKGAGDLVEVFLTSQNKSEQLYGIETLGLIGRREAIPKIETFLFSKDWRKVYAAIRALGQLGARGSAAKIEEAVREHWLWELKQHGERAATLLIRNQPYSHPYSRDSLLAELAMFREYDSLLGNASCETNVWEYRGERMTFDANSMQGDEIVIALPDGELVGTDQGEFGGALVWRPSSGPQVTIVDDNTGFIFPVTDGFISIHGISHIITDYGFAALVTRLADGSFATQEVARFTGAVSHAKPIGKDLFAAESSGRVVTFSPNGIIDAAWCDYSAPPDDKNEE